MAIFLDTGNLDEIKKFQKLGIIRGVTTNPTILLRSGIKGGLAGVKKRTIEIAKLIDPLPLSIEVTTNEPDEMLKEALEIAKWACNINIKITIHGPQGELDNLEIVHQLEKKHNVRVNVTAMMNAQQGFLAALAGASYVSIFGGRVNDMGYDSIREIHNLRKLVDAFGLKAKIIAGSTREVVNIVEWLLAGAHIVTSVPKLIEGMIVHPYSKMTVQQFLADAKEGKKK